MMSFLLLAAGLLAWQPAAAGPDYLERADVRSFIDAMHEKHGIGTPELERILGAVRYQPVVVRLTTPVPSSAPSAWTTARGPASGTRPFPAPRA